MKQTIIDKKKIIVEKCDVCCPFYDYAQGDYPAGCTYERRVLEKGDFSNPEFFDEDSLNEDRPIPKGCPLAEYQGEMDETCPVCGRELDLLTVVMRLQLIDDRYKMICPKCKSYVYLDYVFNEKQLDHIQKLGRYITKELRNIEKEC